MEPTGKAKPPVEINPAFNETYFSSGTYAAVSFQPFSQYWFSNRFYAAIIRQQSSGGKVLEVGCGLGHLLKFLQPRFHVVGTDVNPWALEQSRKLLPQGIFFQTPAEDLSIFPPEEFDIVVCKHVIEHCQRPELAIQEMVRVLKQDGFLLLITPDLNSPMRQRKGKNWIGYRDPTHISLKDGDEWQMIMEKAGVTITATYSDGFWDAPYSDGAPYPLQKIWYGLSGGIQAILAKPFLPAGHGESIIILSRKEHESRT